MFRYNAIQYNCTLIALHKWITSIKHCGMVITIYHLDRIFMLATKWKNYNPLSRKFLRPKYLMSDVLYLPPFPAFPTNQLTFLSRNNNDKHPTLLSKPNLCLKTLKSSRCLLGLRCICLSNFFFWNGMHHYALWFSSGVVVVILPPSANALDIYKVIH